MPKYSDISRQKIIRLRISEGRIIETFAHVLCIDPNSTFAKLAKSHSYIDCGHRDGRLIRLLIDCLRKYSKENSDLNKNFIVPEDFEDWHRLIAEAQYWRLHKLEKIIKDASTKVSTITLAYHGNLAVGKQGYAVEVNFRRINRILVCGRAWSCRQVFGKNLNETRDGNIDIMRYTSRFYLTHTSLEQAFDTLSANGYKLIANTTSNPSIITNNVGTQVSDEEQRFLHYSQFVFVKSS